MAAENKYKYSKAYFKILKLIQDNPKERVFVIRGGQGASKTITILQLIIQSLLSSEKEATVLSSELAKMKRTVVRDYKKICKDWGILKNDTEFNKSECKHEFDNDSYLDFLGADTNDIGKGFRRDILYINEADKMNIETAIQFISRAGLTIIDYNPDSLFWGDDFINENNFITLTFEDNEFLPQTEVDAILDYKKKGFHNSELPFDDLFAESNIKSYYWANKWRVYGLGLVGALDGVVFENWKIIDSIPIDAKLVANGMDFGFTNDPTAICAVYKTGNDLYIDELCYQTRMTNSDICKKLIQLGIKQETIIADSADPKSIHEIYLQGFNIYPAEKGADSIKNGIDVLHRYNIYITKRSLNLIVEFKNYKWDSDKEGKKLNKPIDEYNHGLDSIRYVALNKLSTNNEGQYSVSRV